MARILPLHIDGLDQERKIELQSILADAPQSNKTVKRLLSIILKEGSATIQRIGYLRTKKDDGLPTENLPDSIRERVENIFGFLVSQPNLPESLKNGSTIEDEARAAGISPELLTIARRNAKNPRFMGSGGNKTKKNGRMIGNEFSR